METEIEVVAEKKTLKEILKENAHNIAIGVATLAISGWVAYDNHKRANRKEEKYYDYLEDRLEIQQEALGLPKDDIESDKFDEKE